MNINNINTSNDVGYIRTQYLDYLNAVREITERVEISDNGLVNLTKRITHTELLVPVVGGFSSGKSTLINSFLGLEILPTAITPETALATELRYSQDNYIEAITSDNRTERYELDQILQIKDNAKGFKFLRLFLNNPNLAEIEPLVLVDMPGFDAPIENHHKAILDYLNRGTHFIFLTGVEDGTITRTMHQEIKNLHLFGKSFSFGISKTNLRSADDVQKVKDNISEQLATQYHYKKDVSLFDDNGGENLKKILTAIHPEKLFKSLFIDDLKDQYFNAEDSINLKIAALKADKSQSEQAVRSLEDGIAKIREKQQKAINDVENRYSTANVDSIVNAVGNAISTQRSRLVSLAMDNPSEFQRVISDLVKNNLLSEVKNKVENLSGQIIQDFQVELRSAFSTVQGFEFGGDFIQKIAEGSEILLKRANSGLQDISKVMTENAANKERATNIYRTIATIVGITTSIVNPAIEIALIFLPEIIAFLTKGAKEEQMRRQKQEQQNQIELQLMTEIIPQIKGRIRTELPLLIKENTEKVIQQVATQFEEQLAQKQAEIEQAMAEKEQKAGEIQALIEQLQSAKSQLTSLAQKVIFA